MSGLRPVAGPFAAAPPAGARVRTRLRVDEADERVLREAGQYLGSLALSDLAGRCRQGRLDSKGQAVSRRQRKKDLTKQSSSRWAGAITRASEDQWRLSWMGLGQDVAALKARIRTMDARLAVPAGQKKGRVRGYATQAERYQKQRRLQQLKARLGIAGQRVAEGRVSVVRGGRRLLRARANLDAAGMTVAGWQKQWRAERLFLTADGESGKTWGNETIRWHPVEGWLEIKLPPSLAGLGNRPHGRYRLSRPAGFSHRGDEVAAQAAGGAVRYDISFDPSKNRWYLDASWKLPDAAVPDLEELRAHPVVAVDVNAGHLAAWVVCPDGNPPACWRRSRLCSAGLPASARDGRVRAAISELIRLARTGGARSVVIENLDFAEARTEGREHAGRAVTRTAGPGVPGAGIRHPRRIPGPADPDDLQRGAGGCRRDPRYTSRWGAEHWLAPLKIGLRSLSAAIMLLLW